MTNLLIDSIAIEVADSNLSILESSAGVALELPLVLSSEVIEVTIPGAPGPPGPTGAPYIAPPVDLTDAATILVDASLGALMRVTLGGNRTLAKPTNPADGQAIMFEIKQDGSGGRTIAFASGYNFGTDLIAVTLSTTPGATDRVLVQYVLARDEWDVTGLMKGF